MAPKTASRPACAPIGRRTYDGAGVHGVGLGRAGIRSRRCGTRCGSAPCQLVLVRVRGHVRHQAVARRPSAAEGATGGRPIPARLELAKVRPDVPLDDARVCESRTTGKPLRRLGAPVERR